MKYIQLIAFTALIIGISYFLFHREPKTISPAEQNNLIQDSILRADKRLDDSLKLFYTLRNDSVVREIKASYEKRITDMQLIISKHEKQTTHISNLNADSTLLYWADHVPQNVH